MNQTTLISGLHRAAGGTGTHEGYMPGWANDFETEALPGALPVQNFEILLPLEFVPAIQ